MSDCRYGVSPVNYPDPDPDPGSFAPRTFCHGTFWTWTFCSRTFQTRTFHPLTFWTRTFRPLIIVLLYKIYVSVESYVIKEKLRQILVDVVS